MEKQDKITIWERIVNFIKNIFNKKDMLLIDSPKEQKYIQRENTIEEISKQCKIMALQKDYERGIIKKEELSETEKDNLADLYKKQVEILEMNIAIKKQELQRYKEKIVKTRQRCK